MQKKNYLNLWEKCIFLLEEKVNPDDFNLWLRPLQHKIDENKKKIFLLAPNKFVINYVKNNFLKQIKENLSLLKQDYDVVIEIIGDVGKNTKVFDFENNDKEKELLFKYGSRLNKDFSFDKFVKGKSNEFALASSLQVSSKPGISYNPLLIYGDVGLGKTHLMHAIGNEILRSKKVHRILYLHSERFVMNMVKALQTNRIEEFKNYHRGVDVLLIDDIQFFAGKERSQEEFFHTFNTLLEEKKQIVLTCDRYPKEINGLEERLQSRFGWGLTIAIEPPDLETRIAILMNKAEGFNNVKLSYEVASFIARTIKLNVRELEGALKRVIANSEFLGRDITLDFVRETLQDLIKIQNKLVTISNIQKKVSEYYKIRISDLNSKKRDAKIVRPRQVAITLAKELTNHSLIEIGNYFGGRDHATVIHSYKKIKKNIKTDQVICDDYDNLLRILST